MAPILFKKCCPFLAIPIDFNKKIAGKPIFGKNKTIRGFMVGIICSILIAYLQNIAYKNEFFPNLYLYYHPQWLLIGFLMGFGALFGDAAESFIKRRLNMKPGSSLIPFDQIDHVIGALLLVSLEIKISIEIWIIALIITFFLHILVNFVAFFLKMRDTMW